MTSQFRANREDLRVGTLVRACHDPRATYTGIITAIEETQDLFSEKYAIMETNTTVHVLCDGEVLYFDLAEDSIEVIDEAR